MRAPDSWASVRRLTLVVSAALGGLAGACAAPGTATPADPAVWVPAPITQSSDSEGDLEPSEQVRPISLAEALQFAGDQALDVQAARERALVARAEAQIVRAQILPALQVGAGYFEHHGLLQNSPGQFLDVQRRNASLGGQLRLVFDPGRVLYQAREAERLSEASEHSLRTRKLQSLRLAAHLYFDLVEGYARQAVVETARRQAEELVTFEESRAAVGAGLSVDVERARAHLSATRGAAIDAAGQRDLASTQLAEFLNLDPLQALRPTDSARIQDLVPAEDPGRLIEESADGHPRVSEQESLLSAAEEAERQARYGWLIPSIDLGASFAGFGPDHGDLRDQQIYTAALSWDLSPDIPAQKRRARSRRRAAEVDRRRVRQSVRSSIVRASIATRTTREAIGAAQDRHKAAREAFRLAEDRHRAGSSLLIEVLDAEFAKLGAELALVTSISAFNRAQYDLLSAIGGQDAAAIAGQGPEADE